MGRLRYTFDELRKPHRQEIMDSRKEAQFEIRYRYRGSPYRSVSFSALRFRIFALCSATILLAPALFAIKHAVNIFDQPTIELSQSVDSQASSVSKGELATTTVANTRAEPVPPSTSSADLAPTAPPVHETVNNLERAPLPTVPATLSVPVERSIRPEYEAQTHDVTKTKQPVQTEQKSNQSGSQAIDSTEATNNASVSIEGVKVSRNKNTIELTVSLVNNNETRTTGQVIATILPKNSDSPSIAVPFSMRRLVSKKFSFDGLHGKNLPNEVEVEIKAVSTKGQTLISTVRSLPLDAKESNLE